MMDTKSKMDPMVIASNVYQFVAENDRMRVLKTIFKPGDTAKMHHHPQHMAFVLKGGKIRMISEGKIQELNLEEGKAVFLTEQDHEASNIGDSTIELLVVELK
jgi:quercetin dioxygenase-like cupin family protein